MSSVKNKIAVAHSLPARNATGNQQGSNIMRVSSALLSIALGTVAAVLVMAKPATPDSATLLAATPPMGWNS
jgi:hypothetical protein